MKRKIVKEINFDYDIGFNGRLEDVISNLQFNLAEGWEGIEEHFRGGCGLGDGDCSYHGHYLYKHRPENDKEYTSRMKKLSKEKLNNKKEKEARRKMYESLKKEFGE